MTPVWPAFIYLAILACALIGASVLFIAYAITARTDRRIAIAIQKNREDLQHIHAIWKHQ